MIGASKILTVSYGTFSCTLEGFDDPFNTMRAIAEYFRDLAAEDRYFGAEPPTPDAAMLHRIAEREVQRRVDAKVQENGIHLRATETAEASSPAAVAAPVAPAAPAIAPVAATAPAAPSAETIAERLLRLRTDVAAQQQPVPAPVPQPGIAATVTLPDYVEDLADEPALTATAALADILPEDGAETAPDAPVAARAAAPEANLAAPAIDDAPLAALIARATAPAPETAAPVTEPAAAATAPARFDDLPPLLDDAEAEADEDSPLRNAFAADDGADTLPPETGAALAGNRAAPRADDGDDAAGLDSIFGEVADLPPAQPLADLRPGSAEKLQRARARVFRIRRVDASGSVTTTTTAAPPAPSLDPQAEAELERELAALRDDPQAAPPPARQDQTPPAARGPAHPFGDPSAEDAVSRLMAQADTEMEGEETKRRQSAIAHLKAAVAQTVAERRATESKPDPQPSRIARYRNDLAMVVRAALPGAAPQAKPQGERPAPLVLVSEQRIDRPPRPAGGPIPAVPAAAPPAAPAPIRPRRVSGSGSGLAMQAHPLDEDAFDALDASLEEALAEADDDSIEAGPAPQEAGFRDFAARIGASSLRDMQEAAAAWLTCEQGRDTFTRPQLMRHVALVIPQTDALREDSLRVFGVLLRDGHIAKVKRGHFTLTEASPYYGIQNRTPG